jgi:hypothetical protein
LRTVEGMLEEEVIKRREAEQLADREAKLRRAAEDTIIRVKSQLDADHRATQGMSAPLVFICRIYLIWFS